MTRPFKRVVAMADTHCGHVVGLCPPEWQNLTLAKKYLSFQQEMWQWYSGTLAKLKPIDGLMFLGDAIDGKGEKSGGTELITTDRTIQADMAAACIREVGVTNPKNIHMIFGCLTAGHRILTRDLHWVSVETLKPGDNLLAFEESGNGSARRRLVGSTVLSNVPFEDEVYDLILSDGTTITANGEHRFLLRRGGRPYDWVSVEHLFKIAHPSTPGFGKPDGLSDYFPMPFPRTLPIWNEDKSYEAGYLAGFFDGEGTVNQPVKIRERNGKISKNPEYGLRVMAVQKENVVLSAAIAALVKLGFRRPSTLPHDNRHIEIKVLSILGGIGQLVRFLGQVRPIRLLGNFDVEKLGSIRPGVKDEVPKIIDIRKAGRQTVYGLQTTSKTYISEGFLSHNTPFHTGASEDWEREVAERLDAKVKGHAWVNVNGLIFDLKHYIGGSQVPHGRFTAIGRDMLWNLLWSVDGRQEKADIILRAHVHYAVDVGELGLGRRGIILPGLQGYGSKFGIRRCSGRIDIGFVHFDVYGKGKYEWQPHLFESSILKISATKLG